VLLKGQCKFIDTTLTTFIDDTPQTFIDDISFIIMAEHPSPSSTFVEMEALDVATPMWAPVRHQAPQESYVPTFCHTPTQFNRIAQTGAHVQFASPPLGGSTPAQSFPWEQKTSDHMQLCTPSSPILSPAAAALPPSSSSGVQYDLPKTLPTPGKGIGLLTAQAQGNWDQLHNSMTAQERAVTELTKELKSNLSSFESQITTLARKTEEIKQQVSTVLSITKQQVETESDQTIKAVKMMVTTEFQKAETTIVSEVRYVVQQVHSEIQQDIQAVQQHLQKDYDQLLKKSSSLTSLIDKLSTNMQELQTKMEAKFEIQEKMLTDLSNKSITFHDSSPPAPVTPLVAPTWRSVVCVCSSGEFLH